jgi:agmatine/peptidylarginine deiminase
MSMTQMTQSAVRDAYLALKIGAAKVELKINKQKTKYMMVTRNDTTIRDVGPSLAIGDKHFEVVKEFVYLGSLMTPTNDVSLEI